MVSIYPITQYMVQFVNSGNAQFVHYGNKLNICTISSEICYSEKAAIENMLDILYKPNAIFEQANILYSEKNTDNLKTHVMDACQGSVLLLNKYYPDKNIGIDFCFELKMINIQTNFIM